MDNIADPINDISIALWQANILLRVVNDTYFFANKESFCNDRAKQICFVETYEEIQVLIEVIHDRVFESLKNIEAMESLDLHKIKGFAE